MRNAHLQTVQGRCNVSPLSSKCSTSAPYMQFLCPGFPRTLACVTDRVGPTRLPAHLPCDRKGWRHHRRFRLLVMHWQRSIHEKDSVLPRGLRAGSNAEWACTCRSERFSIRARGFPRYAIGSRTIGENAGRQALWSLSHTWAGLLAHAIRDARQAVQCGGGAAWQLPGCSSSRNRLSILFRCSR